MKYHILEEIQKTVVWHIISMLIIFQQESFAFSPVKKKISYSPAMEIEREKVVGLINVNKII